MDTNKDETTLMTDSVDNVTTFANTRSDDSPANEESCTSMQDNTMAESQPGTAANDNNEPDKIGDKKSSNMGVRAGILIGGVTSLFVNIDSDEATADNNVAPDDTVTGTATKEETSQPTFPEDALPTKEDMSSHPAWADDKLPISKTVNDDMSFSEAFAAARAELGVGASFEWHGKIYGTYTADEWDDLTDENRSEFANHFAWNNIDSKASDVAQYSDAVNNDTSESEATAADDDIEIISVQHPSSADESDNVDNVDISQNSDEVEITAVKFDYSESTDVDVLGITSTNEGADIQNDDMVVDQTDNENLIDPDGLDRLTTPPGDLYALNDTADI